MVKNEKELKSLRTNVKKELEQIDTRRRSKSILFFLQFSKFIEINICIHTNIVGYYPDDDLIINSSNIVFEHKTIQSENRINY